MSERERAIEVVLGGAFNCGCEDCRKAAGEVVDALLALPDPVRDAAREVVEACDEAQAYLDRQPDADLGWEAQMPVRQIADRLRAALEESP